MELKYMSLGENISYLRKQKRMTQEQFAERMNVTRQTVSRWEAEEVVPELTKLVDMCSMFSCSLDALVREKLSEKSRIYSDISVQKIAGFRMAHYAIISQNPEDDANNYDIGVKSPICLKLSELFQGSGTKLC